MLPKAARAGSHELRSIRRREIEEGVVIEPGAIIGPEARIGRGHAHRRRRRRSATG